MTAPACSRDGAPALLAKIAGRELPPGLAGARLPDLVNPCYTQTAPGRWGPGATPERGNR